MEFSFIVLCGVAGAFLLACAGGRYLGPYLPAPLPELLFGIGAGYASYCIYADPYLAALFGLCAYVWLETGHGNAYHMGFLEKEFPPREQTLDKVIMPIAKHFGWANRSAPYCWAFMSLKGILIAIPGLGWYGIILAASWPVSYWLSFRFTRAPSGAEHLTGAVAGVLFAIILLVTNNEPSWIRGVHELYGLWHSHELTRH